MADFTEIIQEINTNLPDNNTQAITATKLRTTMIDLTNAIETQQGNFEVSINEEVDGLISSATTTINDLVDEIDTALDGIIVDSLDSTSTIQALSANQGNVIKKNISVDSTQTAKFTTGYYFAFTVGSAPTRTSSSSYSTTRVSNLVPGQKIYVKARTGSSAKPMAKLLNGLVTEIIENGSSPYEYNFVVDSTFDEIIVNNYTSYISTPVATVTTTTFVEKQISDILEPAKYTYETLVQKQNFSGYSIGQSGTVAAPGFYTYLYNVHAGDRLRITGSFGTGLSSYLYRWSGTNVIPLSVMKNTSSTLSSVVTVEVTVPANATELYVQADTRTLYRPIVEKVYSNSYFDTIKNVEEVNTLDRKRTLNILCLGNSLTQGSMGYVPWILKSIDPTIKLNMCMVYQGGAPIAQYLSYVTHTSVVQGNIKYEDHGGWCRKYTRTNSDSPWIEPSSGSTDYHRSYAYYLYKDGDLTWKSVQEPTIEDCLDITDWDIITYQQGSDFYLNSWDTYYKPYISPMLSALQYMCNKRGYSVKFGYNMTQSKGSTDWGRLSNYNTLVSRAQKVMSDTTTDILFPYATAIQNARTTFLNDYNALLDNDGTHLRGGIGCYVACISNCQTILDIMGSTKTIIGDKTATSTDFIYGHKVPSPSSSTALGGPCNIVVAQQAAMMASNKQLEVSDLVDLGVTNTYPIRIAYYDVKSSNPQLTANLGDSWTSTLSSDTVTFTVTSITNNGVDITSEAWDADTNTATIESVNGPVIFTLSTTAIPTP